MLTQIIITSMAGASRIFAAPVTLREQCLGTCHQQGNHRLSLWQAFTGIREYVEYVGERHRV